MGSCWGQRVCISHSRSAQDEPRDIEEFADEFIEGFVLQRSADLPPVYRV
jgi:hypothetical protein